MEAEAEAAWHELERRRGPAIRDYVKANIWKLERHINAEDTVGLVYHLAWFWHRGTMMYPKLPYTSRRLKGFLLCNPNVNVDTIHLIWLRYQQLFHSGHSVYITKLL